MNKKRTFYILVFVLLTFMLMPFVSAKTTAYYKKANGTCTAYPNLPGFCIQPGVTYSSSASYKSCDVTLSCFEAASAYYGYVNSENNGFWQAQRVLNGRKFYTNESCTNEIGTSDVDEYATNYCKLPDFKTEYTIKMGEDFDIVDGSQVLEDYLVYSSSQSFTVTKVDNKLVIRPLQVASNEEIIVYKGNLNAIKGMCSSSSQNYVNVTGAPYISKRIKINIIATDTELPDEPIQIGSLKIVKTDENGNPVEGAVFKLGINLNGTEGSQYVRKTTNSDGIVTYDNIAAGSSFYYQEISAPEGYTIKDSKIKYIYIGEAKEYEVHVVNQSDSTGSIKITKVDEYGNRLEGVKFAFGTNVNGTLGTDYTIETTDKYGEINKSGLSEGTYQAKEIESLSGYSFSADEAYTYTLVINEEQDHDEITVKNYKDITRKLTIIKKDAANEKTISGAKITIYNEDGSTYKADLVTDEDGIIIVDNIEYGEYYLQEVEAPNGYAKIDEKIYFEITEEEPQRIITIYNESGETKTGLLDVTLYFALVLSAAAVAYTTLKRKQKLF